MTVAAIRQAIIEVMQGQGGAVRTLDDDVFGFGVFDGQPIQAQQARTIDQAAFRHQFDVTISTARPHKATPISTKANYRIEARSVVITIVTHFSSTADATARLAVRDALEQDVSDAIGVLSYPGNLTQTQAAAPTNIASGMLIGAEDGVGIPRWEMTAEDWKRQLYRSRILGVAIINVAQAVA